MTPEGRVKKEIKEYLTSIGAYYFMPVQMGYGAKTLDFLCCVRGHFFGIEAKAPGRKATLYQEIIKDRIHASGGVAITADNVLVVQHWCESLQ